MNYLSKFAASVFSVGWVMDTASTAVALSVGCREANPVWMPFRLGPFLIAIYVGIIVAAWLSVWGLEKLLERFSVPEWTFVPVYSVFFFLGMVHAAASISNMRTLWMSGWCHGGR